MVLHRYAERFEIEEAFKEVKWLQRLEWQQVRKVEKVEVIRSLLLLTFFGWWLLWRYVVPVVARRTPQQKLYSSRWRLIHGSGR
jgi:ABC-type nickel/cobalt efflux system permease component RcnA